MDVRRAQLTGKRTFIISLPKKWANKVNLEKGDPLSITEMKDGSLRITPPNNGLDTELPKSTSIPIFEDMKNETLTRKLIANYLTGYDFIRVITGKTGFIGAEHRNVVRETANELIGMEVIDQTASEITVQCLLDYSKLPISWVMEKMRNIAYSMQEDTITSLLTGNLDLARDVVVRDREVDRLYLLGVKQLKDVIRSNEMAKLMNISPRTCLGYRVVIKCLERISDHATKIAGNVIILGKMNLVPDVRKDLLLMNKQACEVYMRAFEALLGLDENEAEEAIQLISAVEKAEKNLVKGLLKQSFDSYDLSLMRTIIDSLRRTADYGTDIAEIVLNLAAGEPI